MTHGYPITVDRVPFQATAAAAQYDGIPSLPVAFLLDNVRSMYNVGAFFRTADAVALAELALCGITACPPKREIEKTALGAEETVPWRHTWSPMESIERFQRLGYEIAAIETSTHAVDLFDWQPRFPVCVIFGHETDGINTDLLKVCDTHVRIPMLGKKHSLNVATAAGVVAYELLRKYRLLAAQSR